MLQAAGLGVAYAAKDVVAQAADSVITSERIDVLADLPGPHLLVLGDMGEVGDQGPAFHAEALQYALAKNIQKVLVTGTTLAQAAMKFKSIEIHADMPELQAAVLAALPGVASVLVKGSRFMKMERVLQVLVSDDKAVFDAA